MNLSVSTEYQAFSNFAFAPYRVHALFKVVFVTVICRLDGCTRFEYQFTTVAYIYVWIFTLASWSCLHLPHMCVIMKWKCRVQTDLGFENVFPNCNWFTKSTYPYITLRDVPIYYFIYKYLKDLYKKKPETWYDSQSDSNPPKSK